MISGGSVVIPNADEIVGGIPEALRGADICLAFSAPGPGTIQPEWIRRMASDPIVFACANPVPEIWPAIAREAGAKIVATGRSDFSNQVNNSLVFRGSSVERWMYEPQRFRMVWQWQPPANWRARRARAGIARRANLAAQWMTSRRYYAFRSPPRCRHKTKDVPD